jgi:hypothetical protein
MYKIMKLAYVNRKVECPLSPPDLVGTWKYYELRKIYKWGWTPTPAEEKTAHYPLPT